MVTKISNFCRKSNNYITYFSFSHENSASNYINSLNTSSRNSSVSISLRWKRLIHYNHFTYSTQAMVHDCITL